MHIQSVIDLVCKSVFNDTWASTVHLIVSDWMSIYAKYQGN